MSEIGIAEMGPESIVPLDLTPPQPKFRVTAAPTWRILAVRIGPDTFKEPKLMFEGSFKDAFDLMEFLENMPMNTPGLPESVANQQNPQPFKVKLVGPLVTLTMANKRKCLELKIT
jgi:hypothetical protein